MVSADAEQWKEAWNWWYDGMWGDGPSIPIDAVLHSPDYGPGNALDSGKIAMALTQAWITCCIQDAGDIGPWQLFPPTTAKSMGAWMRTPIASGRVRPFLRRLLKS